MISLSLKVTLCLPRRSIRGCTLIWNPLTDTNRYVIAIRDKETDKVIFKDAPVIAVSRTIKSLKDAKHASSRTQVASRTAKKKKKRAEDEGSIIDDNMVKRDD